MCKIKICGLKRECDIDFVNSALPDYIGFVFANTKRYINYDLAKKLKNKLDSRIKAVGVYVNEDKDIVCEAVKRGITDIIQLHGDEDEDYIRYVKGKTGVPIIKAVRVISSEQILKAQKLPCDYLLLDAYKKEQYGGTGKTFCWELIPPLEKPFFLAGGLDISNVKKAEKTVKPFALDISSGVEENGFKSREKIEQIIKLIRSEA